MIPHAKHCLCEDCRPSGTPPFVSVREKESPTFNYRRVANELRWNGYQWRVKFTSYDTQTGNILRREECTLESWNTDVS